jgi:hypothetical protein
MFYLSSLLLKPFPLVQVGYCQQHSSSSSALQENKGEFQEN